MKTRQFRIVGNDEIYLYRIEEKIKYWPFDHWSTRGFAHTIAEAEKVIQDLCTNPAPNEVVKHITIEVKEGV